MELLTSEPEFEGIFPLRCAAHTIQLAVKDLLKTDELKGVKPTVDEILGIFKDIDKKAALESVQAAAGIPPPRIRGLVKPVETRWNSLYDAAERIISLKNFLLAVDPKISDDKFALLEDAVRILKPFAKVNFTQFGFLIRNLAFQNLPEFGFLKGD